MKNDDVIFGRNACREVLKSSRNIEKILISESELQGSLKEIFALAREKKVEIKRVPKKKLDGLTGGNVHQGVAIFCGVKEFCTIEDILKIAKSRKEDPFLLIAEGIEDPHNLGAIIRTAECAGVHGIIIPKRRCAGLTETVSKSSAGALEHIAIAKVSNIAATIEKLKTLGIWIYCADMSGENIFKKRDLRGPAALVVGSEGKGISRLSLEKCDFVLSIPLLGKISSLNVSVATGIILYEMVRNRH